MEARAAGQQQNSGWRSLPRSRCCILLQRSQRNASLRPAVGAGCQWTPTSQSAVLRPRVAGRTPDRQCEVCSSRSAPGLARLGVAGRDSIQLLSLRRCEGNWKVKNKKNEFSGLSSTKQLQAIQVQCKHHLYNDGTGGSPPLWLFQQYGRPQRRGSRSARDAHRSNTFRSSLSPGAMPQPSSIFHGVQPSLAYPRRSTMRKEPNR